MDLTEKQRQALELAQRWYEEQNTQIFTLAGYAGTGKTFTARKIADKLSKGRTAFCAFTGKAALVMQQRGMPAQTIHSLIYTIERRIIDTPRGKKLKLIPTLKEEIESSPRLIIVDEVSMVGTQLLNDLLSFGVPILAIGDPFQLPPVGDSQTDLLQDPDIILDEIVRQDAGSAIPVLADKIRRGAPLDPDESIEGIIYQVPKSQINDCLPDILKWSNQIIAARNSTVEKINSDARLVQGFTDTELPEDGEKIICKRNDWSQTLQGDEISSSLVNGMIGTCHNVVQEERDVDFPWERKKIVKTYQNYLDFKPEFESKKMFRDISFNPKSLFSATKNERQFSKEMIFQFAYCITCHAAQGSEWDKVVLFDDSWMDKGDPLFRRRWQYTGITRAKKQLVWMR